VVDNLQSDLIFGVL